LQRLAALELVRESEDVVLVVLLHEVEELGGGLEDGERWGLRVINQNGNAT